MKHATIGFVVGAALAGLTHAATWPGGGTPSSTASSAAFENPPPRTVVSWVDPHCPTPDDAPSTHQEVEESAARVAELEAQLAEAIGTPEAFPPDLDARFAPENAEATVQAVLDDVGEGELDYVDCSEFPCIAAIRAPAGASYMEEFESPLMRAIEESFGEGSLVGGYEPWMDSRAFVPLGAPAEGARYDYRHRVAVQILDEDRRVEVEEHRAANSDEAAP